MARERDERNEHGACVASVYKSPGVVLNGSLAEWFPTGPHMDTPLEITLKQLRKQGLVPPAGPWYEDVIDDVAGAFQIYRTYWAKHDEKIEGKIAEMENRLLEKLEMARARPDGWLELLGEEWWFRDQMRRRFVPPKKLDDDDPPKRVFREFKQRTRNVLPSLLRGISSRLSAAKAEVSKSHE
jgi:hypothetical protein